MWLSRVSPMPVTGLFLGRASHVLLGQRVDISFQAYSICLFARALGRAIRQPASVSLTVTSCASRKNIFYLQERKGSRLPMVMPTEKQHYQGDAGSGGGNIHGPSSPVYPPRHPENNNKKEPSGTSLFTHCGLETKSPWTGMGGAPGVEAASKPSKPASSSPP